MNESRKEETMKKIGFVFGVHLHQPVGNFEHIFKLATEDAYLPFLRAVRTYPFFKFALHISGPLWEYFERNYREVFDIIDELVERNQVELWGGGFYEPVLAVLPERDALGQIEMMTQFIEKRFGVRVYGIWLTERVWEPHLPSLLAKSGISYTVVDDYHFKSVGIIGDALFGYYTTENEGEQIKIFPISQILRYSIPFAKPSEPVEFLLGKATEWGERIAIYADDGEKFGLWPNTKKWVWEEGWFSAFMKLLDQNRETIEMLHFSEALERHKPRGTIYLPCASYFEMNEWTLPAELSQRYRELVEKFKSEGKFDELMPFLKGGFWRNFLVKYGESNRMHKIMLHLSDRLFHSSGALGKKKAGEITQTLYRAQCNCAYWHGVFGGLYLPHLREGVYQNLIECEQKLDNEFHKKEQDWAEGVELDFDFDNSPEFILRNRNISMYFKPSYGGALTTLFYKPLTWNLLDTLTRRFEGYHAIVRKLQSNQNESQVKTIHDIVTSKERNIEQHLHYDWYERLSLLDHFLGENSNIDSFKSATYWELGDFVNQPYMGEIVNDKSGLILTLSRQGAIWRTQKPSPLIVKKQVRLPKDADIITIDYEIENKGEERTFWFGTELNLALMSRDFPGRYFLVPGHSPERVSPGQIVAFANAGEVLLIDESRSFRLAIESDNEMDIWIFPVETISLSESGFERVYQETSVLFSFRFALQAGGVFRNRFKWVFSVD